MSDAAIVALAVLVLSALGAITWYFIDLWVKSIQKSLEENNRLIKKVEIEVKNLEKRFNHTSLAKTFKSIFQLENAYLVEHQIKPVQDSIRKTNQYIEDVQEKITKNTGKIIQIETAAEKNEKDLQKIYKAIATFHLKKP